jgi:hypothetical protein
MEELLREIYHSSKNDPELQGTLQIEALLGRCRPLDSCDTAEKDVSTGPTLDIYQQETLARLTTLVPRLSAAEIPTAVRALQTYRFIDNIDELRMGRYTRWISQALPNPLYLSQYKPPKLNGGGVLCNISFEDSGTFLHIYSFFIKRIIKYKFDHMLTFQKFNDLELAVLAARA